MPSIWASSSSERNGIRTLSRDGAGSFYIVSPVVPVPIRDARIRCKVRLTAWYRDPNIDWQANAFAFANLTVRLYNASGVNPIARYYLYARTRHPREDWPNPPVDPPERFFTGCFTGERQASGQWRTFDIDLEELLRNHLDPECASVDNVRRVAIALVCESVPDPREGDECLTKVELDYLEIYAP